MTATTRVPCAAHCDYTGTRGFWKGKKVLCLLFLMGTMGVAACSVDPEFIPLVVAVGGRDMTKLPFVIAEDQGLYEKHGLALELQLPPPEFEGGIETHPPFWPRVWRRLGLQEYPAIDIFVDGHTPAMVALSRGARVSRWVALAATDCSVRYYIITRPGIARLEDLEGKRLGINADRSTVGFTALRLLQRMGWERDQDISVFAVPPPGIDALRNGRVDAVVGWDPTVEAAEAEGFPILLDTREWNEQLASNSVMVPPGWLNDDANREAARRFIRATVEAVALFHQRPELVFDVMARWYGADRDVAEARYRRADYVPLKPYPCYEGIRATMDLYDSLEMRRYAVEDFYDDSIIRELDEAGFIDSQYE